MNITLPNNGRADFGLNPFGGPKPTMDQMLAQRCDIVGPAVQLAELLPAVDPQRIRDSGSATHPTSYSHMASIGYAARVRRPTRASTPTSCSPAAAPKSGGRTLNSSINPATGANYPATGAATDVAHLPFPSWGPIAGEIMNGRSNYYGWENTFTKRFSNRWQANATYTLSWFKDDGGIGSLTGPYVTTLDPIGRISRPS